jgi:hypothetical protein
MNLHAAFLFEDRLRQMVRQIPELLGVLGNRGQIPIIMVRLD